MKLIPACRGPNTCLVTRKVIQSQFLANTNQINAHALHRCTWISAASLSLAGPCACRLDIRLNGSCGGGFLSSLGAAVNILRCRDWLSDASQVAFCRCIGTWRAEAGNWALVSVSNQEQNHAGGPWTSLEISPLQLRFRLKPRSCPETRPPPLFAGSHPRHSGLQYSSFT